MSGGTVACVPSSLPNTTEPDPGPNSRLLCSQHPICKVGTEASRHPPFVGPVASLHLEPGGFWGVGAVPTSSLSLK